MSVISAPLVFQQAFQKLALHVSVFGLSWLTRDDAPSDVPLAVMVPLAPKDVKRARASIPMIRKNLAHPVVRFAVVAADRPEIRELCSSQDVEFIDEKVVLEPLLGKARLEQMLGGHKQQFLKLSAPEYMEHPAVVTFDSDTYPIRPTAFIDQSGKRFVNRADANLIPWDRFTTALIGPHPKRTSSYIAHCMLFEQDKLQALRAAILDHTGKHWVEACYDLIETPVESAPCMSEFDIYAHFLLKTYPSHVRERYYSNTKVNFERFVSPAPYKTRFRFVSNHERATG